MKYFELDGKKLSSFQLGTVQLGMKYGLGVDSDKPSEETALKMLDRAMEMGVNNLDTANNYGDSQKVIGHWLLRQKAEGKELPFIITKIGPLKHGSYDILRDDVLFQTEGCRKELSMETLDCLMLHDFEDYEKDADALRKIFEEMKRDGMYRVSGISAYSRHDYGMIAESGFDVTQIPLNVFDWTRIDDGGIRKIADAGMKIFARSTFLQGLVFHTPEDLDPRMAFCIPTVKRWNELCKEFDMEPSVLAMSFILSVPGITCAVLGCDTEKHVELNCEMMDKVKELTKEQMEILHEAFKDTPANVLNPGVWFNHT
ncbi:MAG: aldo/keto reductase [Lachnospiraceae bacterium]|nr:aldo/keto reductase [Lachnospiraceae bacterium]